MGYESRRRPKGDPEFPFLPILQIAMYFGNHLAVPVRSGKACPRASTANAFPQLACRTLLFAIQNLSDAEAVAHTLKHAESIEKVRLPAGVRADEQVHPSQRQIDLAQTLEVLDDDAVDHALMASESHGRGVGDPSEKTTRTSTRRLDGIWQLILVREWTTCGCSSSLRRHLQIKNEPTSWFLIARAYTSASELKTKPTGSS